MRRFPHFVTCTFVCLFLLSAGVLQAEDWPAYRHDNRRSGFTAESLPAASLGLAWQKPFRLPERAWHGPSRFDFYHGTGPFMNMRAYDPAYYPIAVGDSVYLATTGDDTVYCMAAASGKVRWTFTADAPIRIAPGLYDGPSAGSGQGRLYFGSDDGYAYCINAADGKLIWKYRPTGALRRIFNNGNLISPNPVRSGVVVVDPSTGSGQATAYFTAGMLPWRASYFCAVDAKTGKVEGPGRYVKKIDGTPEGAMAAFGDSILQPGGRFGGKRFSRPDGKVLGGTGHGGSFLMVSEDGTAWQGPGRVRGSISGAKIAEGATGGGFGGVRMAMGKEFIVFAHNRPMACVDRQLTEYEHKGKKAFRRNQRWRINSFTPDGLIVAGETIFAGGRNRVLAVNAADGKVTWSAVVAGKACGLAVANGALYVGTDAGMLYCFRPGGKKVEPAYVAPKPAAEKPKAAKKPADAKPAKLELQMHPQMLYTAADEAVIYWETLKPTPSIIEYRLGDRTWRVEDKTPKTAHELTLKGLEPDGQYRYFLHGLVDGQAQQMGAYEFDTFFNYAPQSLPDGPNPWAADAKTQPLVAEAERIAELAGPGRGICVVYGSGTGRLAYEIAVRSSLRVIGFDEDASAVAEARRKLLAVGAYGRVTIHHVESLDRIPAVGEMANFVVSERAIADGKWPGSLVEAQRLQKPDGGKLIVPGQSPEAPKVVVREPVAGTGEWSAQYGTAANCAYGGEELRGAKRCGELTVQWVGRPGPRLQIDRYQRKPSPLSAGGRLFVQGWQRVVALDATNGLGLWSLEVPGFIRFNMPRDCSNYCADDDHLFLAVNGRCFQLDAATGRVVRYHQVQPPDVKADDPRAKWPWDWGYVGRQGEFLVGSATRAGSHNTYYAGRGGWYDGRGVPLVCSDSLFAIRKADGKSAWKYTGGIIINSTITMTPEPANGASQGRVFFTESRTPGLMNAGRRLGRGLWNNRFLVALDLATGRKLYEQKLHSHRAVECSYLAYSGGKLVLASSADKLYDVRGYDAETGKELWIAPRQQAHASHGAHLKRPGIVDGRVFICSRMLDLNTGKMLAPTPGEGCGTISLSRYSMIGRRHGSVSLWAIGDGPAEFGTWRNLRPGCWLSAIPAAGMVLSPEAGAGCRCPRWIEISIGFKPRTDQTGFRTGGGNFFDTALVELNPPAGGGDVYYTMDDTPPTLQSKKYTAPILLQKSVVIRACGASPGPDPRLGEEVRQKFNRVEVTLPTEAKINFEPGGQKVEGYLSSVGRWFQKQGDYAYGYNANMRRTNGGNAKAPEPEATFVNYRGTVKWEICVANGDYDVSLTVSGNLPSLLVEDVPFCEKAKHAKPTVVTHRVTVRDHRLTLSTKAPDPRVVVGRVHTLTFRKQ